ncbi:MAG: TonB C-terminal domain-containing protein [Opitutales bacterium]|jgi:periplasmic protein TonB|nr:TonB C-terminal domain-containing protein [Opitutales bacterium]MDP4778385.1 TonB C-terminal domain-containing protein [Opitutales bacterium]MDP4884076.1 TonB C-terminal domain-containing protein [Opitutales bacterium]MDP5080651.1 TonB C-terminal domain-containing protein [Opitutales bacterium]
MNFRKNQAFWTSVIIHLVVLFGLLLATIVQAFKPKEKIHVFEVFETPSEQFAQVAVDTPPPVEPVEPLDLPDIPDVVTPPPPAPTPPPPTPTPTRDTSPAPAPPKLMSAAEFFKDNPRKEPNPQTPRPTQPIKQIVIKTPVINIPNATVTTPSDRNMSPQEQDALSRYASQINARLNSAWIKPASLANAGLVSEVSFDVSASGRISNIRFNPSSGNTIFDESIRAAFRKVSSAGPTPTGKMHTIKLTFRNSG